jgi:gluconate kinase
VGSLLIVSGPPGAGKSTVSELLAASFDPSILVRGDDFFGFLANGGIDPWLPASKAQNTVVTEAAAAATGHFVNAGYDTVYDGVVGPWYLDRFVSVATATAATGTAATGATATGTAATGTTATGTTEPTISYVVLLPTLDRCLDRVRTRVGHGFTDEGATTKMHHEFSTAAVAARHVLTNDDDEPGDVAAQVLSLVADGSLRYTLNESTG